MRPDVEIVEEGMREGMQIESASIALDDKLRLLDALGRTGLASINVGSFVSPKWVPQMAQMDELLARFEPVPGVHYFALALNQRGVERRQEYVGTKLAAEPQIGVTSVHLCDVFVQRNTAKTQADELATIPARVARAVQDGVGEASVRINAAWGSNWLGGFSLNDRLAMIQRQVEAWDEAGIPVTHTWIGDPMSWNTPRAVEETLAAIVERWPSITTFHLHLHDGRGMALLSAYQAFRTLDERHTLVLDASIGGMGGCPYCGNGRATEMIPTEDLVHLLEAEGVQTGVDLAALIGAAHLAEEVVGHELYGHVSKAGPRPGPEELYPMDMPLVETIEQAQHFRLGPSVYDGCPSPWRAPITSAARDKIRDPIRDTIQEN
ncbi:citramalate synthase [Nocardioides sp. Iso805N]|uniref:citramalate synthase n=1 Tax=Nocardioides sp. Iso805N TaxID=1283287 RepID=UPI0005624C5A|nr:citramalate synthase [Nocardioides sp. Iso805N]